VLNQVPLEEIMALISVETSSMAQMPLKLPKEKSAFGLKKKNFALGKTP